ncbi:MAG: LuxR C-terminal-related transcriptional regulator [Actinomycetota bacterium]|nr:LuxR C-terminal-related transcriptional regulator [Actinomycetota bacterium]
MVSAHAEPDSRLYGALGGLRPLELEFSWAGGRGLDQRPGRQRLFLSPRTVNAHLNSIYHKLRVGSRSVAVRFAVEHGLA